MLCQRSKFRCKKFELWRKNLLAEINPEWGRNGYCQEKRRAYLRNNDEVEKLKYRFILLFKVWIRDNFTIKVISAWILHFEPKTIDFFLIQRNLVINSIQAPYVLFGIYNEVSLYFDFYFEYWISHNDLL